MRLAKPAIMDGPAAASALAALFAALARCRFFERS
jgi:hypothetical protein